MVDTQLKNSGEVHTTPGVNVSIPYYFLRQILFTSLHKKIVLKKFL